ncbi:MAG: PilZ domain-containing protein [Acidimicrobiales bacterium]
MGNRVAPTDLTVLWCPPGTKVGARRASKQPVPARALDISLSGMQVVARHDERVQRGVTLEVVLRDVVCTMRVRWIRPTNKDGVSAYGVEFVNPSIHVANAVEDIMRECYAREGIEMKERPVSRMTAW